MNTSLKAEPIPDEVYEEARRNDAFTLVDAYMDQAQAKLTVAIKHYGHNVDVTDYPFHCSDCDELIHGR